MVTPMRGARLPRPAAFTVSAAALIVILAASGSPAPLYPLYETTFGISTSAVTTAFGCYILGVVLTLMIFGRLSDHLGRRPLSLAAVATAIAGCLLMEIIDSAPTLIVGRLVQGIAVGLGTSALSTYGFELGSPRRPWLAPAVFSAGATLGVAAGALTSGYLVQYVGYPRQTIFSVMIGALLIVGVGLVFAPETRSRQFGARRSLQPRMAVPPRLRRTFVLSCVTFIASWSMGGLYQALAPVINAQIFGIDNHFLGGLIVATLVGTSALTGLLAGRLPIPVTYVGGAATLLLGALLTAFAVHQRSATQFYLAAIVAGIGFGATFLGAFGRLTAQTTQPERAGLLSAIYVVIYLGSATPTVIAGQLVSRFGLSTVVITFGCVVAGLAAAALLAYVLDRRAVDVPFPVPADAR